LARAVSARAGLWLLLLLLAARAVIAGFLPLTADEAYYWLWSKHLDFGYLDHPPAIAWLIRGSTALLGDTAFGVRASGVLLSGLASWFVWRAARDLLKDEARAVAAVLLFNLTLMTNVEMLAATPDMPSIVTSAAFLFYLSRVQKGPPPLRARSALAVGEGSRPSEPTVVAGREADGRKVQWTFRRPNASEDRRGQEIYWLWAGLAAGLSLLSKYSALFLIAGAFLLLLISPRMRPWFKTVWPWAGALLALAVFAPNLAWQATHGWESFLFQFSRVAGHQLTGRFIVEFLGAQLGLASPFIFILGVIGLIQARRHDDLFLPAMLVWPAILYFFIHALHDRVQGNWPCFVYPAFAILAVSAFGDTGWRKWCTRLAVPMAVVFLFAAYTQALTGIFPLGARDPLGRFLGAGFKPVADSLADAVRRNAAKAVLTTDYESTAWLRFYEPDLKVIQLGEPWRYPNAPMPSAELARGPLLYFVEQRRDQSAEVRNYFSSVLLATQLRISRSGQELALYQIYLAEQQKAPMTGRMP
jgi:4-amino-4-deoxy-L-arabinose transferase-like glycosyltransferase